MTKYLIIAIIALIGIIGLEWILLDNANSKWKIAEANVKAYSELLNTEGKKSVALQLTVSLLQYFNDSVLKDLNATRKELEIKDKNLKALLYVKSGFNKVDTIIFTNLDTLFKEPDLAIDTLIKDKWYQMYLSLKYPSTIIVNPKFNSEKHIIVSTKKETVNPPKKFFLARWFLRKHKVLTVDVIEKSPYATELSSKYIEIMK